MSCSGSEAQCWGRKVPSKSRKYSLMDSVPKSLKQIPTFFQYSSSHYGLCLSITVLGSDRGVPIYILNES